MPECEIKSINTAAAAFNFEDVDSDGDLECSPELVSKSSTTP